MSPRQVFNVLDCVRSLFDWARRPDVYQLPAAFCNPFTKELIGEKPRKDPFRPIQLPIDRRIALVAGMDLSQLAHFAIPLVLPLRPEDYTGLLVSEIDFGAYLLTFGTRLPGADLTRASNHSRFHSPTKSGPCCFIASADEQPARYFAAAPCLRASGASNSSQ